ncbi:MAG TPA: metal ABC transporter substrate-binding protein, partial [Anaerolineae bacterium]|nr:metal ABC transporter substrate-binding protein [Anaerolineae bacterium]
MWRSPAWLAVAVLVVALLAACGGNERENGSGDLAELEPVTLAAGERLAVVATTNIVGDIVSQVGGERIDLLTLMGSGVDPHSYVPTPSDSAAIHDAHVVFANGAGLEASLERTLTTTGGDAAVIHLSEGL